MSSRGVEGVSQAELNAAIVEHYHELRVRIPTDVHRQLLALKILRGVTLAETVVIALDRYFSEREGAAVPPGNELGKAAKSP